eukprot:NODE_10385_length_519_cov_35.737374_g9737_i0.p1 GENE.NODE_10385_length_519_cov_35.737374_g9737_i0~~NODE_10385_length_519_cov_35.737374_g9737_i0.p1  ORF type:complete len:150 (-),score=14.32 NODE_10385_length_519_cov_35.737374_g9737_i0:69-476(-)
MSENKYSSYKLQDGSTLGPFTLFTFLHPIKRIIDLELLSSYQIPHRLLVCDKYEAGFQKCSDDSLDPTRQCQQWREDWDECRFGNKQKVILQKYEEKVKSLTLEEKSAYRNSWHKKYFKEDLIGTLSEIRKNGAL